MLPKEITNKGIKTEINYWSRDLMFVVWTEFGSLSATIIAS